MAQSDARFGYRAKLARTDHDLSQPFGFTCAPGQLLPVWFDLATPGDSYYMSHDMPLLRSIQFLAPAMVNVKVHYETFFVPMQMIFEPFENTIYSLKNLRSSLYDMSQLMNNNFPLLNLENTLAAARASIFSKMDAFRLLDMLGMNGLNVIESAQGSVSEGEMFNRFRPNVFPYQLCAYHTIYQYYYRLDDKSQFDNQFANIDRFYNSATFDLAKEVFTIFQRPWDFDYFTSMYRSPIVSIDNLQDVMPSGAYSQLTNVIQTRNSMNYAALPQDNESVSGFGAGLTSAIGVFNTPNIRQLFANEKFAMIVGRTKKNYDSQVLAHMGVEVPHDVKHDITLLHHDSFDLNVQEVTSLASTEQSPLGELAGKSYAAGNGKQFKFTAPCHGVIMTIFSVEPKKRYITGFDKINTITNAFDVPTPEYDRLGNVPMLRYECGYDKSDEAMQNHDIIGWKERFYPFKRRPAKVTFGFFAANGVNNFGSYFVTSTPFGQGILAPAAQNVVTYPRPDVDDRFYIEPGCMDMLCAVPYVNFWISTETGENWDKTPWLVYSRDPFIVNSSIKCKKVSWMSKDGEPIYD